MEKKREISKYSILQIRKLEEHLEQMAQEGWMLEKADSVIWTYHRINEKQMHFSIVFFPKTHALDPEPSEQLQTMWEFCEQTGWKPAAQSGQMQIFYNEEVNPVPIETEAWIQVKNIHESMKGSIVITYTILLLNALLQLGMQATQFMSNSISWLAGGYNVFLLMLWAALGIGSAGELIYYYAWYRKAKKVAEEEEVLFLPKSFREFRVGYLGIAFVCLVFAILGLAGALGGKYGLLVVLWSTVTIGGVFLITRILKARKVSAKRNIIITCVISMVICVVMSVSIVAFVMHDAEEIFKKNTELPIQIHDIRETGHDNFGESIRVSSSIFLSEMQVHQYEKEEAYVDRYSIDYDLLYIKAPIVYDLCKNALLSQYENLNEDKAVIYAEKFQKVDMPLWGAEEVYRYYYGDEESNKFIVCYDKMMLEITFFWDVTDEDIIKVSEIIKGLN